jgi:hypothetical protein
MQVLKTRVINRSLNPVWNEEIILSVPSPPQPLKLVHSLAWISISHTMGCDFRSYMLAPSDKKCIMPDEHLAPSHFLLVYYKTFSFGSVAFMVNIKM